MGFIVYTRFVIFYILQLCFIICNIKFITNGLDCRRAGIRHNIWHITYGNMAVKFAYSTTNGIWHNVQHTAVTFVYGKLNPHGLYVCLYYSSSLVLQRIILVLHVTIQRRKQSDCNGCHDHHQKP